VREYVSQPRSSLARMRATHSPSRPTGT